MELSIGGRLGQEVGGQISLSAGDQGNGEGSGGEGNHLLAGIHLGSNHNTLGAGLDLGLGGHLGAANPSKK